MFFTKVVGLGTLSTLLPRLQLQNLYTSSHPFLDQLLILTLFYLTKKWKLLLFVFILFYLKSWYRERLVNALFYVPVWFLETGLSHKCLFPSFFADLKVQRSILELSGIVTKTAHLNRILTWMCFNFFLTIAGYS